MNQSNVISKKRVPPASAGAPKRSEVRAMSDDDLNVVVGGRGGNPFVNAVMDAFNRTVHPVILEIGPVVCKPSPCPQ
jgi:hypothetical protein